VHPYDPLAGMTLTANAARALKSSTSAKLYSCETLLQRRAADLQEMDQAYIRDGLMGRAKPPGGAPRRAVTREANHHTSMTTSRPYGGNVRHAHLPATHVLHERRYFS
jgi:hypothetical protein